MIEWVWHKQSFFSNLFKELFMFFIYLGLQTTPNLDRAIDMAKNLAELNLHENSLILKKNFKRLLLPFFVKILNLFVNLKKPNIWLPLLPTPFYANPMPCLLSLVLSIPIQDWTKIGFGYPTLIKMRLWLKKFFAIYNFTRHTFDLIFQVYLHVFIFLIIFRTSHNKQNINLPLFSY